MSYFKAEGATFYQTRVRCGDPHEALGVNVFLHNRQMVVSEKRVVVEKPGIT